MIIRFAVVALLLAVALAGTRTPAAADVSACWDACFAERESALAGCTGTLLEQLQCINAANTAYFSCLDACDSGERVVLPGSFQDWAQGGSEPWNRDPYDHVPLDPLGSSQGRMARHGCNVTSDAILLDYLGVRDSDGTIVDPGELNGLLRNIPRSGGYYPGGAVNPGGVLQVARERGVRLRYRVYDTDIQHRIENALADGSPVKIKIPSLSTRGNATRSHFLVVTGFREVGGVVTYDVIDPANRYESTGYRYDPIACSTCPGKVRAVYVYTRGAAPDTDEQPDLAAANTFMTVAATGSVQLLIVDPLGRRAGVTPSGARLAQIPGAVSSFEALDSVDAAAPAMPPLRLFELPSPVEGTYEIRVHRATTANYTLIVHALDGNGAVNLVRTYTDTVLPGQVDTYAVTYTMSPTPDLAVRALSFTAATVMAGRAFTVTDAVKNAGLGAAPASKTRYYLSIDRARGGVDRRLEGARVVGALARNASSRGSASVRVPAATPAGLYYVLACADDLEAVTERVETDNCRASVGRIGVRPPPDG